MTDWVRIKHPDQPDAPPARVSQKAWKWVYKPKGWKLVKGDDK